MLGEAEPWDALGVSTKLVELALVGVLAYLLSVSKGIQQAPAPPRPT